MATKRKLEDEIKAVLSSSQKANFNKKQKVEQLEFLGFEPNTTKGEFESFFTLTIKKSITNFIKNAGISLVNIKVY